jgi:hypothetical protein
MLFEIYSTPGDDHRRRVVLTYRELYFALGGRTFFRLAQAAARGS